MKKVIRFTESDLISLVKRVIEEQAPYAPGMGPTTNKTTHGVNPTNKLPIELRPNPANTDKEWIAIKNYLKSKGFQEAKGKISKAYYTPSNATYLYKNFGNWGTMKVQYPFYDDQNSTNLNRIQIILGRHYLTKYDELFKIPANCIARDKMGYSRIGIYKFCKSSLENSIKYIQSHNPPPREPRKRH